MQWRVEIHVSNSRFIATAGYTPAVDDARAMIARVRAEFADASHNVFAYVVGYGASVIAGMSDDGEPGGTAGRPALAVLRGSGLGDTCVVVTRYFGGTLLGTGGLVRAYGDAVKAVLAELPRTEKVAQTRLALLAPYALYEPVRLLAEAHGAIIEEQSFGVDVTMELAVAIDHVDALLEALREASADQVAVMRHDEVE
ncbi:MAG TPA: YigZ family protein [Herpetosiphonaceae bacterium]|nr:YigZ family protein [Herpetosiphonaceae bacterium]